LRELKRDNMEREGKRNLDELSAKRKTGMQLLEEGVSQSHVAIELAVSRQTVSRWAKLMEEYSDDEPWRARPIGRPSGLSQDQRVALIKMLADRYADHLDEKWTLTRAARVIEEEFGLSYSLPHVWALLGGKGREQFRNGPSRRPDFWERIVVQAYPGLAIRHVPRESSEARRRRVAELVRESRVYRAARLRRPAAKSQ
jgi:transposase